MIHLIHGALQKDGEFTYISNEIFGIQVEYIGKQSSGIYYLFPLLDERTKTVSYFARDHNQSKSVFCKLLKISGIGPKTAFFISNSDYKALTQAVETMDIAFFQKLPGIGPKTAKRLVIELKSVVKQDDLQKINGDDKTIKDIVKYMKGLGYDTDIVKNLLSDYTGEISKKTTPEVIKRLVAMM